MSAEVGVCWSGAVPGSAAACGAGVVGVAGREDTSSSPGPGASALCTHSLVAWACYMDTGAPMIYFLLAASGLTAPSLRQSAKLLLASSHSHVTQ